MAKEFIYNVNGTEFTDNKAFGEAWREAKKVATEEHAAITRTVIDGEKISNEFYSKGGCFLDMETADFNKRANIFQEKGGNNMMTKEMMELYDYMVECEIATISELNLAINLCGNTIQTLNQVLYIKTGYRDLQQLLNEDDEEWA